MMAARDYVLCKDCRCKTIPDGHDMTRDYFEEKWGDPEDQGWTLDFIRCPICTAKLEAEASAHAVNYPTYCLWKQRRILELETDVKHMTEALDRADSVLKKHMEMCETMLVNYVKLRTDNDPGKEKP